MNDTDTRPGLPDQFPEHLRSAERGIREALGRLDLTEWHFAIKQNLLIGARRVGDPVIAIDTVAVIKPRHAMGHRVFVINDEPGAMWEHHGSVDEIVTLVRCWESVTSPEAGR